MRIAFFGSSLTSAYWNGAATYYRGLIRELHRAGHEITFFEPDAYNRQQHRDIEDPFWARVVVYPAQADAVARAVEQASSADLIVKASGVGVFDEFLESAIPDLKTASNLVVFWDVDAPATLDRVMSYPDDPFAREVSRYDAVFTYGGGEPVINAYHSIGARQCVPIYNAVDPRTHHPVPPQREYAGDLAFLGNRLPDRERRFDEYFAKPAARLPDRQFLLAGAGWGDKPLSPNVRWLDHLYTRDHNAFNVSPLAVLNIARDSMARYGFSPATRVFEAAGAGACLITDAWEGVGQFFEPNFEILVASSGEEVVDTLSRLTPELARQIGAAAYHRALAEHTYAHRVAEIGEVLDLRADYSTAVLVS